MKILNVAVLAFVLTLMSGCASVTSDIIVDAKTAPTADLNGYKSFSNTILCDICGGACIGCL